MTFLFYTVPLHNQTNKFVSLVLIVFRLNSPQVEISHTKKSLSSHSCLCTSFTRSSFEKNKTIRNLRLNITKIKECVAKLQHPRWKKPWHHQYYIHNRQLNLRRQRRLSIITPWRRRVRNDHRWNMIMASIGIVAFPFHHYHLRGHPSYPKMMIQP